MKYYLFLVAFLLLLLPLSALAAFPFPYWGPLVSCSGAGCTTCDLFRTGQMIIYFIMTLTLFVVGPIMITAGGIMMLVSAGSEERFTSARKMITGAVIGILIALGAFLIIYTLISTIANLQGFSGSGFEVQCSAAPPVQ